MEEKRTCYHCGKEFSSATVAFNENYYCPDCVNSLFSHCDHCGKLCLIEDLTDVAARYGAIEHYCPSCAENYALCCNRCGRYFLENTDYIIVSNVDICSHCSDNYSYCEDCDRYVANNEWDSDNDCCYQCTRERNSNVRSYHNAPELEFFGDCKKSWGMEWRGIGVELEIDRSEADIHKEQTLTEKLFEIASDRIHFERDGSLNYGFEIITQPHTVSEFYKIDWSKILQACKDYGYKSHDAGTCGLHVHFSRSAFGATEKKQNTAIAKVIYFYTKFWSELLKISRRTASQAERWAQKYCVDSRKDAEHYSKNKYNGRYFAVNNSNADTVEFRLARGTLNLNTFLSWIDFSVALVKNSRRIKWSDIDTVALWLKGIKPATHEYLTMQKAFVQQEDTKEEVIACA